MEGVKSAPAKIEDRILGYKLSTSGVIYENQPDAVQVDADPRIFQMTWLPRSLLQAGRAKLTPPASRFAS